MITILQPAKQYYEDSKYLELLLDFVAHFQ